MLVTRWEPWAEMNRLSRDMNQFFGRSSDDAGQGMGVASYPAINVWEDDENLYAEAELPGCSMEDLEIYVSGNELTIKGQRSAPGHDDGKWHRQERGFGKFNRMIQLPVEVDSERVSAQLRSGILDVTLPKSEAVKPRRIVVKTS
ncbi:MAG: Hsp20/alpha crystallin family protein [Planctomycetaceae bacterium]